MRLMGARIPKITKRLLLGSRKWLLQIDLRPMENLMLSTLRLCYRGGQSVAGWDRGWNLSDSAETQRPIYFSIVPYEEGGHVVS